MMSTLQGSASAAADKTSPSSAARPIPAAEHLPADGSRLGLHNSAPYINSHLLQCSDPAARRASRGHQATSTSHRPPYTAINS